jgi:hypothetical protein
MTHRDRAGSVFCFLQFFFANALLAPLGLLGWPFPALQRRSPATGAVAFAAAGGTHYQSVTNRTTMMMVDDSSVSEEEEILRMAQAFRKAQVCTEMRNE